MRTIALATDYDGTLAGEAGVEGATLDALRRLRASGRKLLLVTGRELPDLLSVFPEVSLFDRVVAENGGLLYDPVTRVERPLAAPASPALVEMLQAKGATPLSWGQVIVSTRVPYEVAVVEAIRTLGLELQVIFNKGAVMILPAGVNKRTGLGEALQELGLSFRNVVGVGDGENDNDLLGSCGYGAAVANALPSLKQCANIILSKPDTAGVRELIERVLADDLASVEGKDRIVLGKDDVGAVTDFKVFDTTMLIAGPSGSGKTTVATAVLERVVRAGFQACVIDPEGDYEGFPGSVRLGDPTHVPTWDEILQLLDHFECPVVNLLGLPLADRPAFCSGLLGKIQEFRVRTARPHWFVFDEAHHLFPADWIGTGATVPTDFSGSLLLTVHPEKVNQEVLKKVNLFLAVGRERSETLESFARGSGRASPGVKGLEEPRSKLEVLAWSSVGEKERLFRLGITPGTVEHDRHRRKYAHGDLEEDSFVFRGPEGRLRLRAQNLALFMQMGEGVDDETWEFHRKRKDYSSWIRRALQDETLAAEVEKIEAGALSAEESRKALFELIERSYTAAA